MQVLKEEIRNSILLSAKMLFLEYGYLSTSMDKIAKKAGISKSNLYNYFEKKEDIFEILTKNTVYRFIEIKNYFVRTDFDLGTNLELFVNEFINEALNPLFSRVKRSRCRSSQEINDAPTPFSALNYCLPICAKASFSLSKPNIAAYETRNPRTTAATTIYHTTAIALIWQ